jgi:peptide/nickel transport system ATP-binding protein
VQLIYQHPEQALNPRWKMRDILAEAWVPDAWQLVKMRASSLVSLGEPWSPDSESRSIAWVLRARHQGKAWMPKAGFLDEMGITAEWLDRYPAELSGGELQRFCIARALAPQTRFIIADEMSTMLDVITQAQIWQIILRHIQMRGLGLLAVTHSRELAERISTRVVMFEELE